MDGDIRDIVATWVECGTCGALVFDVASHERFHAEQQRRPTPASTAVCEVHGRVPLHCGPRPKCLALTRLAVAGVPLIDRCDRPLVRG
jgi:hypothetical protein